MTTFTDLALSAPLLRALTAEGYETPTPIQAKAIPLVLEGRDVIGAAQTGTGKTAAFALPILQHLAKDASRPAPGTARALILSPTRELASQIEESFRTYGKFLKLTSTVVFGGVSIGRQKMVMRNGVDILVATPGRLLDLIDQKALRLDQVEILVLDEADQMLDLGFIHALRRVSKLVPKKRQSLFFSATMPPAIRELASQFLTNPAEVAVAPVATTAERVEQKVVHTSPALKPAQLAQLLSDPTFSRVIVFTRTKHGADKVVRNLEANNIPAAAIHGNKSQNHRERALKGFKDGVCKVLVATDIASRGIDVDSVTHVVNYDLPNVPESYVHRIGRTARAGADGLAISFCTGEERPFLRSIERLTRQTIKTFDIVLDPNRPVVVPKPTARDEEYRDPRAMRGGSRQGGGHGGRQGGGGRQGSGNSGRSSDAQPARQEPRQWNRPKAEQPRTGAGDARSGNVPAPPRAGLNNTQRRDMRRP